MDRETSDPPCSPRKLSPDGRSDHLRAISAHYHIPNTARICPQRMGMSSSDRSETHIPLLLLVLAGSQWVNLGRVWTPGCGGFRLENARFRGGGHSMKGIGTGGSACIKPPTSSTSLSLTESRSTEHKRSRILICKNRIPSEGFYQREEVGFLNLETTAPLIGILSPPQGGTQKHQKHHLTYSPSRPWVCSFLGGTGASSCNLGYRRLQSSSTKSAKSAAISTPVGPPHWEHHHQRVGIQNRGLPQKNGAPQKLLLGHVVDPPC